MTRKHASSSASWPSSPCHVSSPVSSRWAHRDAATLEVYIFISDIIERYVKRLFPGYRVLGGALPHHAQQ